MKELQTRSGKEIPLNIRGILYLCNYDRTNTTIKVVKELMFTEAFTALNAYSNIPNPESQLVIGKDYNELIKRLHKLHANLINKDWLKKLGGTI